MIVVKFDLCRICEKCLNDCNVVHFRRNFESWTSGNDDIDNLIQDIQLSAHYDVKKALEWIPYNRFNNIKYIAEGKFGKEYRANWIDGNIWGWNISQNWERINQNMLVVLKSFNNPKEVTLEFIKKV
jgi:hypothetical protein